MHVSIRNMFPTTRNLQIRVHVYRSRHCCGDWLTFGCFVPMIADQDLVQQIILFSRTVMQRICVWPKIWILSGKLSLMRNVQLIKKYIYIFRVYHIRIFAKKKIGSHDMKQTDSSIIIVRNMCVLTSASMIAYLLLLYRTTELSAVKYFAICS
jgi:hypothetical protein